MTRLILIATITFFTYANPSLAAKEARAASTEIEFERSKLDDPEYIDALYDAIEYVARVNCETLYEGEYNASRRIARCTQDSVARAIEEINAPLLTAHAKNAQAPQMARVNTDRR